MAAHQAAAPKHKRDVRNLKITLLAHLPPRPLPEAVQSNFTDSVDELAADTYTRDESDDGLPPVSALLEASHIQALQPKERQLVPSDDNDVNDLGIDSLTASNNLTTLASPELSDTQLWPTKKP
jgi:hypothetical protein